MQRLKRWIIHKLGGFSLDDFTREQQVQVIGWWAQKAIDIDLANTLQTGFESQYTKNK